MKLPASNPLLVSSLRLRQGAMLALISNLALGCDMGKTSEDDDASGGSVSSGGSSSNGGAVSASGGSQNVGMGGGTAGPNSFGTPVQEGSGSSMDRWAKRDVKRDGKNYYFMANGWGPGFQSQSVSWSGTSFTVTSMQGTRGPMYEPASYPTMFCGVYSDSNSGECGLPKALDQIVSLKTGWRWRPNGNSGQYNAAYDIWLSTNATVSGHSSFLMVWLRDPPGQQPAGSVRNSAITVAGVPGSWNIWSGNVSGKPCVSYVRPEGQDSYELEFDVMAFVRDASTRGISLPGTHMLSVAVGFEIWAGPITNLVSDDFYVDPK
jgi:hypothetical protein